MTTVAFINQMPHEFHPEHRGAPYLIGDRFKNHGEYIESSIKFHMGLDHLVNPSVSYDKGSDIPSICASVKSSHASLGCVYGATYEEIKSEYFSKVHSTQWIYGMEVDGKIHCFYMNRNEFETFMDNFHTLTHESGRHDKIKVQFLKDSKKMFQWLSAQC